MADWLFGAVPFLIGFGGHIRRLWHSASQRQSKGLQVALISFALAGVAFLLSVIIWFAGAIPVVSHGQ